MNIAEPLFKLNMKVSARGAISMILVVVVIGAAMDIAMTAVQKAILREHNCAHTGKMIPPKGSLTVSTNRYVYACDDHDRTYGFLVEDTRGVQ